MFSEEPIAAFEQVSAILEPMLETDLPKTQEMRGDIADSFVGGDRFIRVLGDPLWLQEIVSIKCQCGSEMIYIVGIGYERYDHKGLFSDRPFFFGEIGLYYFYCTPCGRVSIIPQST